MKGLTESQAHALARAGGAVRREAWRHWLVWSEYQAVVWVPATANAPSVEQVAMASEFTLDEFLATDWTDESWTLPDAEGGGEGPRPPGVNASSSGGSGGGSGGSGGSGGGGGSSSNPPGADGPLTPGKPRGPVKRKSTNDPSVSVSIAFLASPIQYFEMGRNVTIDHDDGDSCFIRNLAYVSDVARVNLYLTATVAGLPASGGASIGVLAVRIAGQLADEGFMNVGNGQHTVHFTGFTFVPGGTITATASLRNDGKTFDAPTVNKTFDPWCAAVPTEPAVLKVTLASLTENDPSNYITAASPNGEHLVPWSTTGVWTGTFATGAFDNGVDTADPIQWYITITKVGSSDYAVTCYPDIGAGRGGFINATGGALGATLSNTISTDDYFHSGTAVVALP